MIVLPHAKLFKLCSPRISVCRDNTSSFINFKFLLLVLLPALYRLVRFLSFVSLPALPLPSLIPRGVAHDPLSEKYAVRDSCRLIPTKSVTTICSSHVFGKNRVDS